MFLFGGKLGQYSPKQEPPSRLELTKLHYEIGKHRHDRSLQYNKNKEQVKNSPTKESIIREEDSVVATGALAGVAEGVSTGVFAAGTGAEDAAMGAFVPGTGAEDSSMGAFVGGTGAEDASIGASVAGTGAITGADDASTGGSAAAGASAGVLPTGASSDGA